MQRLSSALPLLLVWAGTTSVATAAPDDAALLAFLRNSAQHSDARFAAMAERVNPYQLPLVAVAVNAREREHGIQTDGYEAIVRWHFWLAQQLDTQGKGMWSLRSFGPAHERTTQRRESAIVAALQRLQLRALAEMATRRGRTVDALAWWREERLVERRMIERLYDPVLGGYVDVDSLGTRISGSADLRSLITVGLGAPTLSDAASEIARHLLAPADSAANRVEPLALALDPANGWWVEAGAAELGLELCGYFLRRGVALSRQQALAADVEAALTVFGLQPRSASAQLGSLQLPIDDAALRLPPFARCEAALGFLARTYLVSPRQAAALLARVAALRRGECSPDSVSVPLLAALVQWRKTELTPNDNGFLREGESLPPPPNGEGSSVFRYAPGDLALWSDEALLALTQDLLAKHLAPRHESEYAAMVHPRSVAFGGELELRVSRDPQAAPTAWPLDGWRAAWSDGSSIRPSSTLQMSQVDELHLSAQLPAPPSETGMWWLILSSPLGAPRETTGVSVVEPLRAELARDGVAELTGEQRLRIALTNHTLAVQRGKVELELPTQWQIQPAATLPFEVEANGTQHLFVTLRPEEGAGPGQYSLRMRVSSRDKLLQEFQHELAIPFRWIMLGAFAADAELQLDTRCPGDEVLDLGASYPALDGKASWTHVNREAIQAAGWIELVAATEARGLRVARTVISSASREIVGQLESSAAAEVFLNGHSILRSEGSDGLHTIETSLDYGANHVVVKLLAGGGQQGRFRLSFRDIEGGPLLSVDNRLEHMLDGYTHVRGGAKDGDAPVDRFQLVPITFQGKGIQSVAVVGSFNGWSPSATPMVVESDGRWKAEIRLPLGQFEYKLAIDGIRWIADPGNPLSVPDGFGGKNSLLVLK